ETACLVQQQINLRGNLAGAGDTSPADQTAAVSKSMQYGAFFQHEEGELLAEDLEGNGPVTGDGFTRQLNDVDESAMGRVDAFDYSPAETWKALTARRQKWAREGQAKNGKDKKSGASGKSGGKGNQPGSPVGGPGPGLLWAGAGVDF